MAEPLKPAWQASTLENQTYMSCGGCDATVTKRGRMGYEVGIWLDGEHVFESHTVTLEEGQQLVEAWLEANYPL